MNVKYIGKIAGAITLLLMSSSVMAAWSGQFLLGGSGGYAWRNGNLNVDADVFTAPPRTILSRTTTSQKMSDHGFLGGVFAGYQVNCHRLLFGAELAADWDHVDTLRPFSLVTPYLGAGVGAAANPPFAASVQYERGTVLGLSFRAGYKLYPWLMPYIRLGTETSRDKLIYNAEGNPGLNTRFQSEDTRRVWRFLGGIGVEAPLFWLLSARAEYNYSSEGRSVSTKASSIDNPAVASSPIFEHDLSTKQDQHTAKVSVVLNFPAFTY